MRKFAFKLSSVVLVYISYKCDFIGVFMSGTDAVTSLSTLFTLSKNKTFFFLCLFLFYILKKWSHRYNKLPRTCVMTLNQTGASGLVLSHELNFEWNEQTESSDPTPAPSSCLGVCVTRLVYKRVVCWSTFFVLEIASDETFTIFREYRCVSVSQMLTKEACLYILSAHYTSFCTNFIYQLH